MRLTNQRNQCPGCGKYFARTSGFVKHRIGKFGTGPLGTSPNRRCMTQEEMLERGFYLSPLGFWRFLSKGEGHPQTWLKTGLHVMRDRLDGQ